MVGYESGSTFMGGKEKNSEDLGCKAQHGRGTR